MLNISVYADADSQAMFTACGGTVLSYQLYATSTQIIGYYYLAYKDQMAEKRERALACVCIL